MKTCGCKVSDLVELTKQQAMTIRRLEKDSLAKSDRIADLETRYIAYWDIVHCPYWHFF